MTPDVEPVYVLWFRRLMWWTLFVVFLAATGWVLQQLGA